MICQAVRRRHDVLDFGLAWRVSGWILVRMMSSVRGCGACKLIVLAMVCGLPMAAQQAESVTGHVTYGDTQRPARLAEVLLLGVPKDAGPVTPPTPSVKGGQNLSIYKIDVVQTATELDGSYSAAGVMPGDYYVFVSVPGYVQPRALVQAAIDAGADPAKQLPGIPVVHVGGEGGATADITVQRGGAISGHVMWDDGSPAAKVFVTAVSTKASGKNLPSPFGMLTAAEGLNAGGVRATSDDLGSTGLRGCHQGITW